MMSPTHNAAKRVINLAKRVRARAHLQRAWLHVERRAASSPDEKTQKALAVFRENPQREIASICRRLGKGTFVFEPQRAYAKPRKGKRPRPIVVAPIVNRIVQRAILDICQTENTKIRKELGNLPQVIACTTSVGGLPNKGVPEAVQLLRSAIRSGAKWYVRSDLVNFFTDIKKSKIESFLRASIDDHDFVSLFMRALETELSNEEDVRKDLDLFPIHDEGVPQGSALSALCANIILAEFDREMNRRGITTIRYLDDFVILAPTKKAADKAWSQALKLLTDAGLTAHEPTKQTGKASMGEVNKGFVFLSFRIDDQSVAPSKEARLKFIKGLRHTIRDAKKVIEKAGHAPRRAQPMFLQTLILIDKKTRGWGDAFRSTSNRLAFAHLDQEIDNLLNQFIAWFGRTTKQVSPRIRRRKIGVALLLDTEPET